MKTLINRLGIHPMLVKVAVLIIAVLMTVWTSDLYHAPTMYKMSFLLAVGTFVNLRYLVKYKITSYMTGIAWAFLCLAVVQYISSWDCYKLIHSTPLRFALSSGVVVFLNSIAAKASDYVGISEHEGNINYRSKKAAPLNSPIYIALLAIVLIVFGYSTW